MGLDEFSAERIAEYLRRNYGARVSFPKEIMERGLVFQKKRRSVVEDGYTKSI